MSTHSEAQDAHADHGAHDASHYYKVYFTLLALFAVSVAGPMLEIRVVTLITAFGVACVKAFLVAKHFMHLTVERKVMQYAVGGCLALMLLFFFAVAPDVMKHYGVNWDNRSAVNMKREIEESERRAASHDASAGGHEAPAAAHGAAPAAH